MTKIKKDRYSDKELSEFQSVIDKKISIFNQVLSDYRETLSYYEKLKGVSDAAEMQARDEAAQKVQEISFRISVLEEASGRVRDKTYGIDDVTGKLIAKERLKAVPEATFALGR